MKRTKKLLSFFLAIMMVITTIPAFTLTTNAADWSGNLTTTDSAGYRYYAGHNASENRINSSGVSSAVRPTINVCNDGGNTNFCAGLWVFDMNSNIPTSIKSITATLTIKVIAYNGDSRGVNFYITGDTPNNVNNNSLTGNSTSVETVKGYFSSLTLVKSVAQSDVNKTATYTIDVSNLVKNARLNGWNRFNVLAIQETAGDGEANGTRWSDLHIEKPKIYVNAVEKKLSTTASADVNENSSTYRVVLDDAIYTFESESAYYNYGTNISTLDPWDTQVIFKSGSRDDISSIICLDNGAELSLNGTNKLQGDLLADKFKVSTGATDVNATLLFTFKDGTQEYHRVAVKSYPVENHIMASAEKKTWNNIKTETGFTMFMRGSTGSGGLSSLGVWKYYKDYYKSGTSSHGFPDKNNNSYTTGKKAQTFKWVQNGEAATDVSLATYYIDKSCKDTSWAGLGNSELWDGRNYTISIDVVRTRFEYENGTNWNNVVQMVPTNNYTYSAGSRNDANGTTYPLRYTNNASVTTSQRYTPTNTSDTSCNVRVALNTTGSGYAVLRTNMVVNLFDKSIARSKYDELIRENLKENDYTASSFAKYQNALMDMEAYLSNYEDTDTSKMTSLVNSLNTARNNLVVRGDTQTVLNKLAAFQAVANEQKNSNKYTKTSYTNFVNAQWPTLSDNMNNALNLMNDTLAQRELTVSLATTYIDAAQYYLDFLVENADFTALASQYSAAATKLAETDKYTTSTYNTLKDLYDNAVYAKYSDTQKADTSKPDYQSAIDAEKDNIAKAINDLVQRANFQFYDRCVSDAATALGNITAKDGQYIRVYRLLEPYTRITLYTEDQKANTPISEQTPVNNKGAQIEELNTNVDNSSVLGSDYVDQTALKAFIDKNFDLDVVDNSNIKTQKDEANGLYEKITFNGNEYWSLNVASQSDLDSNIARYINNINSTLGQYDIKVPSSISVAVSGQPQTPTSTSTIDGIITHTYRLTYGVPIIFTSTNADTAWYMKYQSNVAQRGMQYQCSGLTYATKVMGNMTVTPKSSSNSKTPNKVTVVRQYSDGSSSAMLIDYVNGSYVLPTAQTYPNYTFTRYEVNGTPYNAGATVAITGDTVIYAKYEAANSNHQIIITDTNGTRTDSTYKYNSAVKLNDPNAYAWIEKPIGSGDTSWRPSYIGTGCSYKVTEPMELKAVKTEAEMKQYCGTKEAYAPNLRFNGPLVANGMGVVFHGQFINYVPAGAQIVEYGVAVNTNNANSFDLINTNGKVIRCKSTNPMKSNQFSVGARYNGDTFTSSTAISYRSYMIYQVTVGNQLETRYAYSDVRTFNPNPNA